MLAKQVCFSPNLVGLNDDAQPVGGAELEPVRRSFRLSILGASVLVFERCNNGVRRVCSEGHIRKSRKRTSAGLTFAVAVRLVLKLQNEQ